MELERDHANHWKHILTILLFYHTQHVSMNNCLWHIFPALFRLWLLSSYCNSASFGLERQYLIVNIRKLKLWNVSNFFLWPLALRLKKTLWNMLLQLVLEV